MTKHHTCSKASVEKHGINDGYTVDKCSADQPPNGGIDAPLTYAQLIRAIGGATHIARLLNRNRVTVQKWAHTGIPPEHYVPVARLAHRAGVYVTVEQIADQAPGSGA